MTLPVAEFINRLKNISVYAGEPFGRVHMIFEEESAYGLKVAEIMSGYLALSDSFKAFYLETIERLNTECRPKVKTPLKLPFATGNKRCTTDLDTQNHHFEVSILKRKKK